MTGFDPLTVFDPTKVTVLTNFDPTRVMGLTNWFDSGEFFVGLLINTSYYSKLWLINRGNLTDKHWYDT